MADVKAPSVGIPVYLAGMTSNRHHPWASDPDREIVGTFVMEGRVERQAGTDTWEDSLIVAVLHHRGDARYRVRFFPGVTGHEEYIFDLNFVDRVLSTPTHTDEDSIFGGKEIAEWALNLGGGGYRAWRVAVDSMQQMVNCFKPVLL